jgi:hypothetical protein
VFPTDSKKDGAFRRLEIKTKDKDQKGQGLKNLWPRTDTNEKRPFYSCAFVFIRGQNCS